jgi:hypothetical protein
MSGTEKCLPPQRSYLTIPTRFWRQHEMPRGPPIPKSLLRRAFLAVVPSMLQRHQSIASLSVFKGPTRVLLCLSIAVGYNCNEFWWLSHTGPRSYRVDSKHTTRDEGSDRWREGQRFRDKKFERFNGYRCGGQTCPGVFRSRRQSWPCLFVQILGVLF